MNEVLPLEPPTATMNKRVSDVTWQSKIHVYETYNSLRPLTWILNIFAINCNVMKPATCSKFCHISKCLIVVTVLGSLSLLSLALKHIYIYKNITVVSSIMFTDTVQMIFDLLQYLVDLSFVYKYGRHISVEYFKQYENIDSNLGMTYYGNIKWELTKLISMFTFIWLSTSIFDFVAWSFSYGGFTSTVYMITYIFLYLKILTMLDLSAHVMHIRFRLMIIGNIIHEYYTETECLPGFKCSYLSSKNWLSSKRSTQMQKDLENTTKLQRSDESKELDLVTRCYFQLTEQVEFINSMYGFRILLNSLSLLIDLVRFTNTAIRILHGTQHIFNESRYFPAASVFMRQVTCALVLLNLVNQSEKVYRESENVISTIDHILINKNPSDKLRTAMTKLRGLIRDRPISFTLANFFRIDKSLLVSITSVVVTYSIILLQSMN